MSLPITITEGGENLYIHPIAFSYFTKNNKVFYFNSPEFTFYKSGSFELSDLNCLTLLGTTSKYKIFYYAVIKRLFVAIKRYLQLNFQFFIINKGFSFPFYFLIYLYRVGKPFIAVSIYEYWFSVKGQLVIEDPFNYSDTYYLVPSQTWLESKVEQWINREINDPEMEDYYKKEIESFVTWRDEQLSKGLSIGYLCSLDT